MFAAFVNTTTSYYVVVLLCYYSVHIIRSIMIMHLVFIGQGQVGALKTWAVWPPCLRISRSRWTTEIATTSGTSLYIIDSKGDGLPLLSG